MHAAYLEDGDVVQPRLNHVEFVARSLYLTSNYFGLQLPAEYGFRIDMNQFLSSFSMIDNETGQRKAVTPWVSGPGYGRISTANPALEPIQESDFLDQRPIRAQLYAKWLQYYFETSRHIPYAALKVKKDNVKAVIDTNAIDEIDIECDGADSNGENEVDNTQGVACSLKHVGGGRPSTFSFALKIPF